jgi:2,3-bisphosphoglycerate-dependent phosphoglycerate mutase
MATIKVECIIDNFVGRDCGTFEHMSMTLVLLRHGESTWNQANLFTGWRDVPLSTKGEAESTAAGELLSAEGLRFDKAHTSLLLRAVQTADLALAALDQLWLPVERSWRLNERHYGALQGLDKKQTADQYGLDQVKLWRRSYDVPPPPVSLDSPEHPGNDPRYARLAPDVLPASECLADVVARVLPYWHDHIVPDLRAGLRVLVVAHGNSLRALLKHLERVSDADIAEVNLPTGIPRVYELGDDLQVQAVRYLGDATAVDAAAEAVRRQAG